jgi:hypothetical protein
LSSTDTHLCVIKVVRTSVDPAGLSDAALTLRELLLGWDGDM